MSKRANHDYHYNAEWAHRAHARRVLPTVAIHQSAAHTGSLGGDWRLRKRDADPGRVYTNT